MALNHMNIIKALSITVLSLLGIAAMPTVTAQTKMQSYSRLKREYSVQGEELVCTADKKNGYMTYRIKTFQFSKGMAAWVEHAYKLMVKFENGKVKQYAVSDFNSAIQFDHLKIKQVAASYNIPEDFLKKAIFAHEKQHASDHKDNENSLISFIGFENSSTGDSGILKRYSELTDRLEALAMTAQLNTMTRIAKKYPATKNMTKEELKQLMFELSGSLPIEVSGTTYEDAYKAYAENKTLNAQKKELKEAIKKHDAALMTYFQNHYQRVAEMNPNKEFESTRRYDTASRPVCMPCMMGDTLGKCKYIWCPNFGNRRSEFRSQKGDYIPSDYEKPFETKKQNEELKKKGIK